MSQETPVAIFWDIDRLPLPSESPTYEIVNEIIDKAREDGFVVLFKAYSDVPELANGGSARYDLQSAGVSFIGCAQDGTKNVTISTDMLLYAMDHPAPATLIVISDDNQLIYVCSILRMRKYRVIVDTSSHAGHRKQNGGSAFVNWAGLTGAISCDNDQELDSRSVQSEASDSSYETATSNPLGGSHHEAANQVSYMRDATSSLRASSRNSELSAPSSRTFGSERIDDTYQNNHHCGKYPACHCTRWHEAEDAMTDRGLHSATETTMYRTRSLSLTYGSPHSENPPPIEPFVTTSKPEEKTNITTSPPSTKSLQASETAAALALSTEHGDRIKTQATAVEEAQETESVDTPKTPLLTVAPVLPESSFQEDASATGADMSPDDHSDVSPLPPQSPVVFQALVDELRYQGGNLRQATLVASGLMKRDPTAYKRAGVSSFKDYIDLAVDVGIVTTMALQGRAAPWISLSLAWRIPPNSANPHPTVVFQALVDELRHQGENLRLRSVIADGLLRRDPISYKRVGVSGIKEYIDRAVDAGIVTVSMVGYLDRPPDPVVSLSLAWRLRPPSPLKTANAAPQDRSLFQELVDELRQQPEGSHTDRGTAATGLLRRNPSAYTRAGVTSFKLFAAKAVAAGVVTLGNSKNRAGKVIPTIYLTPAWKLSTPVQPQPSSVRATQSSTSISRRPSPLKITNAAPQDRSLFQGLVDELRHHGTHPVRSHVALGLLGKAAYTRAGVTSFKQFTAKAVAAGVVTLGNSKNRAGKVIPTIYLTPAWRHSTSVQPQPPSIRATQSSMCVSRPPLKRTNAAPQDRSLFQELTDELRQQPEDSHPERDLVLIGRLRRRADVPSFSRYAAKAVAAGAATSGNSKNGVGKVVHTANLTPAWKLSTPVQPRPSAFPDRTTPLPTAPNLSPFRNLVEELRRWSIPRPNRIAIAADIGNRHPLTCATAGCANFDEYFARAMEAGIVSLGETISPGRPFTRWISLNQGTEPRQSVHLSAGSTAEARSPSRELPPQIAGRFKSLIAVLQQEGDPCLDYFGTITRLREYDPSAFKKSGVVGGGFGGFKGYVTLAEEAGVITVSETGAQGARIKWISLNLAWRLAGASIDSPLSATVPSKRLLSIPKSFSPLVEHLREMRDNNITRPFRWRVHAALIYSKIDVGDFSKYLEKAELAGIVTLGGWGQREWIALAVD
ncbi:hypothetical protein FIBSPDRAFT_1045154 [Athelia psychrophila]|uniref:NYN domain-containing protein n=1 Tax=Athelia psychrophila TaxID=1759441 RepID=A0A166IRJ9_9AGAM|nr:hypothetical protein FIBSPDRAFT_1045154 [Fibularhizoctonia sp. CBS 109695]